MRCIQDDRIVLLSTIGPQANEMSLDIAVQSRAKSCISTTLLFTSARMQRPAASNGWVVVPKFLSWGIGSIAHSRPPTPQKRKGAPVTVSSPNVTEIKLDRLIDDMRLLRSQMIAFDKHLKGIEGGGPRFISPCKVDRRTLRTAPTLFSLQNTALDTLAMLDSVIRDVGSMSGLALGLSTRGDKALVRNEARNGFRRSYAALIST
jgi:hypothetical protein